MRLSILEENESLLTSEGFLIRHYPSYTSRNSPSHNLDVILFSWFVSGRGIHYIGENNFPVSPGSLGMTPLGIKHSIEALDEMEIYNLFIHPPRFPLPEMVVPYASYLHHLLPLHSSFAELRENGLQIKSTHPSFITSLFQQLFSEQESNGFGSTVLCHELLKLFFMELIRDIACDSTGKGYKAVSRDPFPQGERIMKVASYLDASFSEDHSLDDLAILFGYSKSVLCSHFKRATGKTIFEYILLKRMERCTLLLKSTSFDISSLAMTCGFRDLSYFNKKFKKITGMTPREFRKSCEEAELA